MKVVSSLTTPHIYFSMMVPDKIPLFINNTSSQKRGEIKSLIDCHSSHQCHNSKTPETYIRYWLFHRTLCSLAFLARHGNVALNPLKIQVAFQHRFLSISEILHPTEFSGLFPWIWGIANLSLWTKRLSFACKLTWPHLESLYYVTSKLNTSPFSLLPGFI